MTLDKKLFCLRKKEGLSQVEVSEKLDVSRQAVSRWESGTALPDVEKVSQIASILNVSCDYLLNEEAISSNVDTNEQSISRLLENLIGKKVKLNFYEDEEDFDLLDESCKIESFQGNWVKVTLEGKKKVCKLIALSSILSIEIENEGGSK